jgi:hypothetical protein
VDCMQPPSTRPAPNRTSNNPLIAIFFLFLPPAPGVSDRQYRRPQLTEKLRQCHDFRRFDGPSCECVARVPHTPFGGSKASLPDSHPAELARQLLTKSLS